VFVAAGTYAGAGPEVVLVDTSIELLGVGRIALGRRHADPSPTRPCSTVRTRRVVTISGGAPTIDGFTITRGNGTGLTAPHCGHVGAPNGLRRRHLSSATRAR